MCSHHSGSLGMQVSGVAMPQGCLTCLPGLPGRGREPVDWPAGRPVYAVTLDLLCLAHPRRASLSAMSAMWLALPSPSSPEGELTLHAACLGVSGCARGSMPLQRSYSAQQVIMLMMFFSVLLTWSAILVSHTGQHLVSRPLDFGRSCLSLSRLSHMSF